MGGYINIISGEKSDVTIDILLPATDIDIKSLKPYQHEVKRAAQAGDEIKYSSKCHKTKPYRSRRNGDVLTISTILLPDDYTILE